MTFESFFLHAQLKWLTLVSAFAIFETAYKISITYMQEVRTFKKYFCVYICVYTCCLYVYIFLYVCIHIQPKYYKMLVFLSVVFLVLSDQVNVDLQIWKLENF